MRPNAAGQPATWWDNTDHVTFYGLDLAIDDFMFQAFRGPVPDGLRAALTVTFADRDAVDPRRD